MAEQNVKPTSPRFVDHSGKRFGGILVIERVPTSGNHPKWRCVCSCGRECFVTSTHLVSGHTKQCFQCGKVIGGAKNRTHGLRRTVEYNSWVSMRARCERRTCRQYKYYGARGITVCERWQSSFENFITDMGCRPSPKHSIDRIDNNGNYEPSNCRWATPQEQMENRRNVIFLEHDGRRMRLKEWEAETGLAAYVIHARVFELGWSVKDAVTVPVVVGQKRYLRKRR